MHLYIFKKCIILTRSDVMVPVESLRCTVQALYLVLYQSVEWTVMALTQMYVNKSREAEKMLHASSQLLIPAFLVLKTILKLKILPSLLPCEESLVHGPGQTVGGSAALRIGMYSGSCSTGWREEFGLERSHGSHLHWQGKLHWVHKTDV